MKTKWVLSTQLSDGCLTSWWCGPKKGWQELPKNAFVFPDEHSAKKAAKDLVIPKVLFDIHRKWLKIGPVDLIKLFKGRK